MATTAKTPRCSVCGKLTNGKIRFGAKFYCIRCWSAGKSPLKTEEKKRRDAVKEN